MSEIIPWNEPAIVAFKRKGEADYRPWIAGLTLNAALKYATDPTLPSTTKVCIMVKWEGQEVRIEGRRIFQLAADPSRPPLPPE